MLSGDFGSENLLFSFLKSKTGFFFCKVFMFWFCLIVYLKVPKHHTNRMIIIYLYSLNFICINLCKI